MGTFLQARGHRGCNTLSTSGISSTIEFDNVGDWLPRGGVGVRGSFESPAFPFLCSPPLPPRTMGWDVESCQRAGRAGERVEHSGVPWPTGSGMSYDLDLFVSFGHARQMMRI